MNSFINVQIRVTAAQAQAQLRAFQLQVAQFGAAVGGVNLVSLGSQIQWVGRQLEYNFTLPLMLAGGAAFKFAMDNQAAMVRVIKVYGDATHGATFYAKEINSLQKAFEALSNEFGVNQAATINIAADWAQAGASGLALAKAVKLTMQTMVLGEMDAAAATKALISIQAQYGFSIDQLTGVIAVLNMVENQTALSLADLVDGFARSAGMARDTGVDVRHLAAYLAALTPATGSAANAGNALKTIFSRLIEPTKQAADVIGLMGININDASWQSASMVDKLDILAHKFVGLSDAQQGYVSSVISSRWQVNRFDILMKEIVSDSGYYAKALNSTADSTANFAQMTSELNTVLQSNPQRLKIMWTMLQNAMADIIQPLIPLIMYLAQVLVSLVQWFSNLDPGIQKIVLGLAFFLAAVGPVVRYLGALVVLVRILAGAFGLLFAPIAAVAKWLWGLLPAIAEFLSGGLIAMLGDIGGAIVAVFTGPWGIAIAAVLALLATFHDQLSRIWSGIVSGMRAAWDALPSAIQGALLNVVRTIAAAVTVAREWLSYLNPWARHSPSLVDNVTTGVAEIIRQFKMLTNVDQIFGRAGVSVGQFAQDLYDARQAADQQQWDKILSDIQQYAPNLTGSFNDLMAVLGSLRSQLTALQASMPLEELKAMDDAIFANSEQVKALQLQYMKLEDATGPLDQLKSKLDALNGQRELLSGEKAGLRNAGAGGEILSQYDDQLKALDEQKKTLQDAVKPLQDLADQIAALQRAGQELQLEEDLKFDPIKRQADELTQAIQQVESALQSLGQTASSANGGKGGIGSIPGAGDNFPDVGGTGQIGREGGIGDQSSMIDDFTKQLAQESGKIFGSFSLTAPLKKAWESAWGWLSKNFGPPLSAFWGTLTGAIAHMPNPFSGISFGGFTTTLKDIGHTLSDAFSVVWKVLSPALKELWDNLVKAGKKAWTEIGPAFAQLKELVKPLGDDFKKLWEMIKPIVEIIGGALLLVLNVIIHVFANVLGPTIDAIIVVIKALIKIFMGVIDFLSGVFTGQWSLIWKGIKEVFGGVFDAIVGIIGDILKAFWGIIKGIGEGIWGFLKGTVGGYIDSFVGMIAGIPGRISGFFGGMFDGIGHAFKSAINWVIGMWDSLPGFTIGGGTFLGMPIPTVHIGLPWISPLAQGGMIDHATLALIGEGRAGYPEFVIPTDPMYRGRALQLFGQLGQALAPNNSGGSLGSRASAGGSVTIIQESKTTHNHFHGNLEFPNVTDGNDAEEFIRNLEALLEEH